MERHVDERPHGLSQRNVVIYLQTRYPRMFVRPEQRVHVHTVPGQRSSVPDVCVFLDDPHTEVFDVRRRSLSRSFHGEMR